MRSLPSRQHPRHESADGREWRPAPAVARSHAARTGRRIAVVPRSGHAPALPGRGRCGVGRCGAREGLLRASIEPPFPELAGAAGEDRSPERLVGPRCRAGPACGRFACTHNHGRFSTRRAGANAAAYRDSFSCRPLRCRTIRPVAPCQPAAQGTMHVGTDTADVDEQGASTECAILRARGAKHGADRA